MTKLNEDVCKNSKFNPEGKGNKLSDGHGLYLHVKPAGKYWRMNYRYGGKQKTLALGVYPKVSLEEARKHKDKARKQLANNVDPATGITTSIHINTAELNDILFYCFRYCLGRQTYAVADCVNYLRTYWHIMSDNHKRIIHKEIRDAIENGWAGDPNIDVPQWESVLKWEIKDDC